MGDGSLIGYVTRRLAQAVVVVLAVGFVSFTLQACVGDPVATLLGVDTPQAVRDSMRRQLGLDDPLPIQYGRFLWRAARGDFGVSYQTSRPAMEAVAERLPATVELTLVAAGLATLVGIPAGVYTALHRESVTARGLLTVSLVGVSLPTFIIGMMLILVFAVHLGWLPPYGRGETVRLGGSWSTGFLTLSGWKALVMPALSLALVQMTLILRLVRAELLEVLRSDYIRFARARGLPARTVHYRHALRNSLLPVVTVVGLQVGTLLAFAIVTETVFQWPGMGLLFIQALSAVDVPVITAFLMLVGAFFAIINLVVDLAYYAIDPRLRERGAAGPAAA